MESRYSKKNNNIKDKNKNSSNPFVDALIGFFIFFFSIPVLFFGERRSVR
jgi:hypothetical protein